MSKSKTPKLLAGVNVGDAIWSGGKRWIVCAVGKAVVHAERTAYWGTLRSSWRFDGKPSTADAPAEIETPERFARWKEKHDADAERARMLAEADLANRIASKSIMRLSIARSMRSGGITAMPLAKARALERFVDQLTRDGE